MKHPVTFCAHLLIVAVFVPVAGAQERAALSEAPFKVGAYQSGMSHLINQSLWVKRFQAAPLLLPRTCTLRVNRPFDISNPCNWNARTYLLRSPEMSPGNKAFRFVLELAALGAMGWWGYDQGDGAGQYILMAGVPITAAAVWGVFAVPGDPSRGQDGLVRVSGVTRLFIEGLFFGFATWALHDLGRDALTAGLGGAVVLHYALSIDRLKWLVKQ